MAYETVVAAFDTPAHADAAVKALRTGGFADADISVFDDKRLAVLGGPAGVKEPGLWQRLFGRGVHEHEAAVFGQTVSRGGSIVSARVIDREVAHAIAILDLHHPVSVPDRAVTAGIAKPGFVERVQQKVEATPLTPRQTVGVSPKLAEAQPEVLKLAEEQLQVGKELIESGRTRVRRFVTEQDASMDVSLHEEHAEVLRRAITDPKYAGEVDWADKAIEFIETAEHPLVSKTARIVEEVSFKRVGADHVETIRDKIRRQQAEVEHLAPGGKGSPETRFGKVGSPETRPLSARP
jgi:uncharacterized protein (TIGR02271 family)